MSVAMNAAAEPTPVPLPELARRVLPGGHLGNYNASLIVREGNRGRIWDINGKEYVDLLLGSGPMFIGHNHPAVTEAVIAQIPHGTTFFANSEPVIRLAAEIIDAVPCAEQVRFVSSGSEADMFAMRLARAWRRRDKILKFEGAFHGMADHAMMSHAPRRPGNFPQAVPDSPGIPRTVASDVLIAPFNDADLAANLIREHRDELAGVILEPFQRLLPPQPGFLQALRQVTQELEIPLIFDEIVTGFRFAWGGAQEYYGVTPDLCTLGKVVGGGFPLAAIAGRADIMAQLDRAMVGDERFVMLQGTLSGNPVAATAGLATLNVLKQPGAYDGAYATGRAMMEGVTSQLAKSGLPGQVVGMPLLFDIVWTEGDVHDYRATLRDDAARRQRVNLKLREAGIIKGESKCYVSLAHDEADVRQVLDAFAQALAVERAQG